MSRLILLSGNRAVAYLFCSPWRDSQWPIRTGPVTISATHQDLTINNKGITCNNPLPSRTTGILVVLTEIAKVSDTWPVLTGVMCLQMPTTSEPECYPECSDDWDPGYVGGVWCGEQASKRILGYPTGTHHGIV
jgi:hypothetical protein